MDGVDLLITDEVGFFNWLLQQQANGLQLLVTASILGPLSGS